MQRRIGAIDIKSKQIYFHVWLTSNYSKENTLIPFNKIYESDSSDGAFDLETGIFVAPRDGLYYFTFSGDNYSSSYTASDGYLNVKLKEWTTNEEEEETKAFILQQGITGEGTEKASHTISIHGITRLKSGDRVGVELMSGTLRGVTNRFSGFLIHEFM